MKDLNGKTVVGCDNGDEASAVIEMYFERKTIKLLITFYISVNHFIN